MNVEDVLLFLRALDQAHYRAIAFVGLQERCEWILVHP